MPSQTVAARKTPMLTRAVHILNATSASVASAVDIARRIAIPKFMNVFFVCRMKVFPRAKIAKITDMAPEAYMPTTAP